MAEPVNTSNLVALVVGAWIWLAEVKLGLTRACGGCVACLTWCLAARLGGGLPTGCHHGLLASHLLLDVFCNPLVTLSPALPPFQLSGAQSKQHNINWVGLSPLLMLALAILLLPQLVHPWQHLWHLCPHLQLHNQQPTRHGLHGRCNCSAAPHKHNEAKSCRGTCCWYVAGLIDPLVDALHISGAVGKVAGQYNTPVVVPA